LRGSSAPARLLEQHRHHAAAQARAYAPDLGGDLGRRVLDPAEAETREVRRQIGGDVDLARREAADQLADDQLPQAAAPLRHEHELRVAGEPSDTLLRLRRVDLHAVYLARDGVRIELLGFASPPAPPPRSRAMNEHGLTHLSFRVADLDATLAALRAAGERVL